MRPIFNAFGSLVILLGVIWLLEEYGILNGSLWEYQIPWPHRGLIAIGAGIVFIFFVNQGERH